MKDEFDSWNEIKIKTNEKKRPLVKVGQVYWCRVGYNIGYEENGKGEFFKRPVLIIKKFSREIVFGIPLTSKIKNGSWYFNLKDGSGKDITAILNQAKPFDTKRFEEHMFQISETAVENIVLAFTKLLSINK